MPKPHLRWRLGGLDLRYFAALACFTLLLLAFRYRTIKNWLPRPRTVTDENLESIYFARQVTRAVHRAARFVPGARCLAQAVTVKYLLARSGHKVEILIGVAPPQEGNGSSAIRAHAWLECDGEVVAVTEDVGCFTPLLRIG